MPGKGQSQKEAGVQDGAVRLHAGDSLVVHPCLTHVPSKYWQATWHSWEMLALPVCSCVCSQEEQNLTALCWVPQLLPQLQNLASQNSSWATNTLCPHQTHCHALGDTSRAHTRDHKDQSAECCAALRRVARTNQGTSATAEALPVHPLLPVVWARMLTQPQQWTHGLPAPRVAR